MPSPTRLLSELRRRRVLGTLGVYAVLAYGVVEAADLFVPALGLPPGLVTAVAVLALAGAPVAAVLGWLFDFTGQGIRRTAEAEPAADVSEPVAEHGARPAPTPRSPAALLAGGVGVGILIALGAVGAMSVARAPSPAALEGTEIQAIAVLPFADRSPGGDDAYFSDGLTEELLNALARRGDVRVAGRSSSFRYRGDGVDVREVGDALGVQAVLEGSVQRDGARLRVTAQLTETRTGYTLWADAYDRQLDDVFAVQEELARRILAALDRRTTAGEAVVRQGTADLEAYDHYLRGNWYLGVRTLDATLKAIDEYRRAAALDPAFAAALHRQGYAHALIADWGWSVPGRTTPEVIEEGARLVDRALALDDASADAWLARGYLRVVQDPYAFEGALPAFERALALDPDDAEIRHQYAQVLTVLGRFDDAMAQYARVLDAEPDRSMTMVTMAAINAATDRYDETRRWADSAVAVGPGNAYARAYRASVAVLLGDTLGARAHARDARRIAGDDHPVTVRAVEAFVAASTGDLAAARAPFEAARAAAAPDGISPAEALYLAIAANALGDRDAALGFIEAARPRGAWLWFYLQGPHFDPMRDEPRFRAVVDEADARLSA